MDDENYITLIKDLCASFLSDNQRTTTSEPDLSKLVKKTLSNFFVRNYCDNTESSYAYVLLKTEIVARILSSGSVQRENDESIRRHLNTMEELHEICDENDELNLMFLFLYKLSQFRELEVDLRSRSKFQFFNGSFNGTNWNIFHQDPGPVCAAFDYPFNDSPGTGLKFIQDYCQPFPPLSSDFSKIFDGKPKIYRFDLNQPVEPISQDEGFVTPGSEFSHDTDTSSVLSDSSAMSTSSSPDEYMFDSQCLKLCKKTWEQLGSNEYCAELPFASEHLNSVIPLWKIYNASQNPKVTTFSIDNRTQFSFNELKNDLQYLLFGMNSTTFFYNCFTKTFYIRDKVHLETLSPEIVSDMCEPFLQCAAYYYALKTFVERRTKLPFGPTHQVFCRALLDVLNMYRYSLLNLNWDHIRFAVQLEPAIVPFQRRLQFLTKFCLITIGEEVEGSSFPSGVQLLDYLYSNLMKIFRTDFSFILIHLFEKCCNMYLKIVSEWIFEGCFSNPANYSEFFIEIHRDDELHRDWRRVSCIKLKEKRIPKFLEKFYKDVFICGKSINLLKIFTRRDVLNTILPKYYPALKCCFNKNQLNEYVQNWQKFQRINNHDFNLQKRIKKVLFKTYEPDFYAEVKRVRQEWFINYENRLKSLQVEDVEERSENNDTITEETNLKMSEMETRIEVVSVQSEETLAIENEEKLVVEAQEEKPKLKTKQLVEFYEQLNSSSTTPTKSPRHSIQTPPNRSPKLVNLQGKTADDEVPITPTSTATPNNSMSANVEVAVQNNSISILTDDLEFESPSKFSDYKGGSESGWKEKTSTPVIKYVEPSKKSTSLSYLAAGDYASPISTTIASSQQTSSACGDASSQTPSIVKDSALAPMSDLQRNQLKSVYSDQQNLLNDTNETTAVQKKAVSSPLTTCQQNRIKCMSSENLRQYYDRSAVDEKRVVSTPLSIRDQNKLKIMSSEYHQRLRDRELPCQSNVGDGPAPELSESEKNKLKVMSSEYHVRLMDYVSHGERLVEKLNVKSENKLTALQMNKRKVMEAEFDMPLKSLPISLPSNDYSVAEDAEDMTPAQQTCFPILADHEQNNKSSNVNGSVAESEVIDEDSKSEDPVTVLLNVTQSHFSASTDRASNVQNREGSVARCEQVVRNDVLNMERYVSFGCAAFAQNPSDDAQSLRTAAQSVRDVDRTSLLYYLSQSIAIPLRVQSKIVNEAILRVFIEEEDYLQHLNTLRNYMFLRKAEFCFQLTNTMFKMVEKIKKPYLLLNNYTISCLLQQALLAANARESIHFERKLFFVIDEAIPQSFDLQDIQTLKCVSLNYSVKWPVNVLITEPIIKKYSRIFKFLLQIQRVSWTLKNDFKILKNLKRGKSIQHTQIQFYRHNMTHVVRILQEFVMRNGIENCWNELVDYISNSDITLDGLYISHLKYINKILQRCFLCEMSITCHESVLNLFSSILRYHAALRAGTWNRNLQVNFLYHTNFKNIQVAFEQFQQYLNEVRAKLKFLVYNKQRLYFEPLLFELSRNICNR